MPLFSAFEILAENLVPPAILPPGPNNPFALQGYWVQISLAAGSSANFNIIFTETTGFSQGGGKGILQAQYIDGNGQVQIYKQFFDSTANGFLNQRIDFGKTIIYGVQAIPGLSTEALPQGGTGWRGTVQINPQTAGSLIATPTQRLVYYDGDNIATAKAIDAVVYAVPTLTGNTRV